MYLVIDIGGTYTKYSYYDHHGQAYAHHKFQTIKTNLEDFYQHILDLIQPDTEGIAISMPGLIDSQKGYVEAITLLPFLAKHYLVEELNQKTHLPITIENDAKCATLGELWKGSLQHVQNALMIVLGSGIGGKIVVNGKILDSPHHKVGEIGSLLMPLDMNYQTMTNFGRQNNANALIHMLAQVIGCQEDGEIVFEKIQSHPQAYTLFQKYCRQIAFMIYNLDYILDLDVVSIGGGISEQALLLKTIQQEFQALRDQYKEDAHQPIIMACQYHNEANLLGALYHHISKK